MSISKKTNALVLSENSKVMIYKDLARLLAMPRGRLASVRQAIVGPVAGVAFTPPESDTATSNCQRSKKPRLHQ